MGKKRKDGEERKEMNYRIISCIGASKQGRGGAEWQQLIQITDRFCLKKQRLALLRLNLNVDKVHLGP